MSDIKVVASDNKEKFENKLRKAIRNRNVADIKFAVSPRMEASYGGGTWSSEGLYYAIVIYE